MTGGVEVLVDGRLLEAPEGITVAALLLGVGQEAFRDSVTGAPRGPLCGMGVCFECRVTIDGVAHRRACLALVAPGMRVTTRD